MLSHDRIWAAIDALAERYRLTAVGPGTPRRARPDDVQPRRSASGRDGRQRWPSTESVSKILKATGDLDRRFHGPGRRPAARRSRARADFRQCRCSASPRRAPAASSTMAAFRPGRAGTRSTSRLGDENVYALKVTGDSMLPLYRDGDTIIVSPTAPCRQGDRVVVKTARGRGDGQGAEAEDRRSGRTRLAQSRPSATARWPSARSSGSRGSSGRASSAPAERPRSALVLAAVAALALAVAIARRRAGTGARGGAARHPRRDPAWRHSGTGGRRPAPPRGRCRRRRPRARRGGATRCRRRTDAATFDAKRVTIRVSGVVRRRSTGSARRAGGEEWPCGRTALYALRMFLRGRAVECYLPPLGQAVRGDRPVPGRTDRPRRLAPPTGLGARPTTTPPRNTRRRRSRARCEQLGLWQGTAADGTCPASGN